MSVLSIVRKYGKCYDIAINIRGFGLMDMSEIRKELYRYYVPGDIANIKALAQRCFQIMGKIRNQIVLFVNLIQQQAFIILALLLDIR